MKSKLKETIEVVPFNSRYQAYFQLCKYNAINCLEGAYRAGKTLVNISAFAYHVDHCEDATHLVTGYSMSTALNNVVNNPGSPVDLMKLFSGRCRLGKEGNKTVLYVKDMRGSMKYIYIIGGGTARCFNDLQGLTFSSWLSVELANLYVSEDDTKDFIHMCRSRVFKSKDPKIFWDLNPVHPNHLVYKKYLDKYEKQQSLGVAPGGYNYMRCSIFDNTSLTKKNLQFALGSYPDKTSIGYRRYILGERAASDGIVFKQFAINPREYIVESFKEYKRFVRPQFISIGIDFGGNGSNTAFCATVISDNFSRVMPVYSDEIDMSQPENQTVRVYSERFKKFLRTVYAWRESVAPIRCVYCDYADTVMVNETARVVRELAKEGIAGISVENCYKSTIKKRIDTKNMLLDKGRYHVFRKATHVIDSTSTQVWNDKPGHEDERLDDHTADIDIADAEEYSWSNFMGELIERNMR